MKQRVANLTVAVFAAILLPATSWALGQSAAIRPGEPWLDNRGQQIQAHGGGVIRIKKTYYWFGEDRTPGNDPDKRYVSCYSSRDLLHWTFRNQILKLSDPENLGPHWVLERPKVFYNAKTKRFVLYAHLEDAKYELARVAVAASSTVDGDYKYVKSFRPLNEESRDIGQFIDTDGSAYLIFESRPTKGFFIAKLSSDYMNVETKVAFLQAPLEGGALAHDGSNYYVMGSHMTGWQPNPNVYAVATNLNGPWSEFKNIAPPEDRTYGSQSSMLLTVVGTKKTTVIYIGDLWKPKTLWDSRYLWMPLELDGDQMRLAQPRPWTLDVKTGLTRFP
jgi:Glycosyl hydrolases family 43